MKAMSKSQVVSHLAAKAGIKRRAAATVLDELATLAIQETKGRGRFVIPGLAKAVKANRKARVRRDPRTGEPVKIATKPAVKFRRASATSDEVFANLARAFSSL